MMRIMFFVVMVWSSKHVTDAGRDFHARQIDGIEVFLELPAELCMRPEVSRLAIHIQPLPRFHIDAAEYGRAWSPAARIERVGEHAQVVEVDPAALLMTLC